MLSFFKKKKIIPHIKLSGVIGNVGKFKQGIDFSGQEDIILKAFSVKKAPCVAITINSPGGSPVQSHLIYNFIREQAKKNKKKVIVFAEDVAASGGYLIACAGDEIYANSSSIIGSIGVIYSSFGFTEFIKKDSTIHDKIFLIEANPKNISKLKESYKNFNNARILNLGVTASKNNEITFFYTEDDAPYYMVCSTKINHVLKHYPNSKINEFKIKTVSVNNLFKDYIKEKNIPINLANTL